VNHSIPRGPHFRSKPTPNEYPTACLGAAIRILVPALCTSFRNEGKVAATWLALKSIASGTGGSDLDKKC
jgi:hypothetical protein